MPPERAERPAVADRVGLLLENIVDYAIFTLDPGGHIETWSPGAQRLKGYTADDIIGRHFSCFYPEGDVRAGKPAMELEGAARDGRFEDEGWRIRKDGSRFWANVVITALRDADGTLCGFGKVTRDLTQRKEVEDALRKVAERETRVAEQLRGLDRLKSDLVAIVAHDLKAPLGIIGGFAQVLRADWESTSAEERDDFLLRIESSVAQLRALIDDVLEVARIESGELRFDIELLDVAAVVDKVVAELTPLGQQGRVRVTVASGASHALGDARRVWQVLTNLIGNALKFSGADRPVDIELQRVDDEGELHVSVRDRGPGIDAGDHANLFDRFSRIAGGDPTIQGTGLGLYIARALVEAQDGRIWVDSEPGRGATFSIALPLGPGPEPARL